MPVWTMQLTHKKQSKMFDCWYACIQMLISYDAGAKTKPQGTAQTHRQGYFGHKLGAGATMDAIKGEHGLVDVSNRIFKSDALTDAAKMNVLLHHYGPIMISGTYGGFKIPFMNRIVSRSANHFIVVAGTDTDNNKLWIHDPLMDAPKFMSCDRCHDLSHARMGGADTALAVDPG